EETVRIEQRDEVIELTAPGPHDANACGIAPHRHTVVGRSREATKIPATASPPAKASVIATPATALPRLATAAATATAPIPVPRAFPRMSASCIDEAVAPSLPAGAWRKTVSEIELYAMPIPRPAMPHAGTQSHAGAAPLSTTTMAAIPIEIGRAH